MQEHEQGLVEPLRGDRLLDTTAWPVTRITTACGYTSVVTFRQNFTATYATTPTSYRQRFSASST